MMYAWYINDAQLFRQLKPMIWYCCSRIRRNENVRQRRSVKRYGQKCEQSWILVFVWMCV